LDDSDHPPEGRSHPPDVRSNPAEVRSNPPDVRSLPSEVESHLADVRCLPMEVRSNPAEASSHLPEARSNPPDVSDHPAEDRGNQLMVSREKGSACFPQAFSRNDAVEMGSAPAPGVISRALAADFSDVEQANDSVLVCAAVFGARAHRTAAEAAAVPR